MELSGICLGRRSARRLDRLLAAARSAPLSYDHSGSTVLDEPPAGVTARTFTQEAQGTIEGAAATLRRGAAHDGIAGRLHPAGVAIEEGASLLVVAPFGPFEMAVPDRIIAVVDEPGRFGFAYGTIAGHPEAGEELFLAEATGPGRLVLTVRVHARPATRLARLGGPVVGFLQQAAARRYLRAWADAIEGEAR